MEEKPMKNTGYNEKLKEIFNKYENNDEIRRDAIEFAYRDTLKTVKEKWRRVCIGNLKTPYRVSNKGNLTMDVRDSRGRITPSTHTVNDRGYKYITLHYFVNVEEDPTKAPRYVRVAKYVGVHRLVATYFCKLPARHSDKDKMDAKSIVPNHKDGIPWHNAAFNLEWVTPKENSEHAWENGFNNGYRGENSHLAKVNEDTAKKIIDLIMKRYTNKEILERVGSPATLKMIQHIRSKECWKHLTKDLEFPKLLDVKPFSITDDTIHNICKDLENNKKKGIHESDPTIAMRHGVKREIVRDIRLRKKRTSISKNYDF